MQRSSSFKQYKLVNDGSWKVSNFNKTNLEEEESNENSNYGPIILPTTTLLAT